MKAGAVACGKRVSSPTKRRTGRPGAVQGPGTGAGLHLKRAFRAACILEKRHR